MKAHYSGTLLDINADKKDAVDIEVREDGEVVWVNVNGVCVLRICQVQLLLIETHGYTRASERLRRAKALLEEMAAEDDNDES